MYKQNIDASPFRYYILEGKGTHLMLTLLNDRSKEIFRLLVDTYCQSGEPVGSKTVAERMSLSLSTATIRHVMAHLEELGLLYSPHPSSGRVPTDIGLRLFIDGLLEVSALPEIDKESLNPSSQPLRQDLATLLEASIVKLSNLSRCASLVLAPKCESALKHLEFIPLHPGRALVVLVTAEGVVENRLIDIPLTTSHATLVEASNFINRYLAGQTLQDTLQIIEAELKQQRTEISECVPAIVEAGLGIWTGDLETGHLIIRGQSQLLNEVAEWQDVERLQRLFDEMETRQQLLKLLKASCEADGVQIFIGSANSLFSHTGCAMIVAPYHNRSHQIIGAIGVIGPAHLHYARIIPMVDYTSQLLSRSLGS